MGSCNHSNHGPAAPGSPRPWGAPAKGSVPGSSQDSASSLPSPVVALSSPLCRWDRHWPGAMSDSNWAEAGEASGHKVRSAMPGTDPGGGCPGALPSTPTGWAPKAAEGRACPGVSLAHPTTRHGHPAPSTGALRFSCPRRQTPGMTSGPTLIAHAPELPYPSGKTQLNELLEASRRLPCRTPHPTTGTFLALHCCPHHGQE